MNDVIRRKLRRATSAKAEGGPGADHGWRLALARAARARIGLPLQVLQLEISRRSLAELLELPPDRAMLVLLDGPGGAHGLMALAPECFTALIEWQTLGRVLAAPPLPRRPTRTDAAMVADVLDHALAELGAVLADEADLVWAGGFRYASFLEDARPLALLLEDQPYRLLTAQLCLGDDAREGHIFLALPAEGRGSRPPPRADAGLAGQAPQDFASALSRAVMAAETRLEGVIGRVTLPLQQVLDLAPGVEISLTEASIARISLLGMDGRRLATARLGQNRGMRALRLWGPGEAEDESSTAMPVWQDTEPMAAMMQPMPEAEAADILAPLPGLPELAALDQDWATMTADFDAQEPDSGDALATG